MRIIRRKILRSRIIRKSPIKIIKNKEKKIYKIEVESNKEYIIEKKNIIELKKKIKEVIKRLGKMVEVGMIYKEYKKEYKITRKGILVRMGKGKGKSIGEMEIIRGNRRIYTIIIIMREEISKERIEKIIKGSLKNITILIS